MYAARTAGQVLTLALLFQLCSVCEFSQTAAMRRVFVCSMLPGMRIQKTPVQCTAVPAHCCCRCCCGRLPEIYRSRAEQPVLRFILIGERFFQNSQSLEIIGDMYQYTEAFCHYSSKKMSKIWTKSSPIRIPLITIILYCLYKNNTKVIAHTAAVPFYQCYS